MPSSLRVLCVLALVSTAVVGQGRPTLDRVLKSWHKAYDAGRVELAGLAVARGRVDPVYGQRWLRAGAVDMTHRVALLQILDLAAEQPDQEVTFEVLRLASKGLLDGSGSPARSHFAVRQIAELALLRHRQPKSVLFLMQLAAGDFGALRRRPADPMGLRIATILALGRMQQTVVRPTLHKQLAAAPPVIRLVAAEALGAMGSPHSLPRIAERLGVEVDPVVALGLLGAAREIVGRAPGAVGDARLRGMVVSVIGALGKTDWRADLAAVEFLGDVRSPLAIPALIGILERFAGKGARSPGSTRLRLRAFEVLRSLTGAVHSIDRPADWRAFWERERDGFVVAKKRALAPTETAAGFFGIPVRGSNVLFIIDTSGSMSTVFFPAGDFKPAAGQAGQTRMGVAKRELLRAVGRLPTDAKFNVIEFNTAVHRWRSKSAHASRGTRRAVAEWVRRIAPGGATNIYEALDQGLGLETLRYGSRYATAIDEIFLLSDGEPTAGLVLATDRLLDLVRETNRFSMVRINTLYMGGGGDSEFMRDLARQNGGRYVRL